MSHLGGAVSLQPPSQVVAATLNTSTPLLDLSYPALAAATSCGDHGSDLERRGSGIEAALHPAAACRGGEYQLWLHRSQWLWSQW